MKPLLIAHRGDTINFSENTVVAFGSAFDHGAGGIELDVQFYNGKLIVVHDYLFDKNKKYPELSEVLSTFSGKGRLELEIKPLDLDFLPQFKQLIDKYEDADIEITTSVWPLAHHLRQTFPEKSLGIIFPPREFEDWMPEKFVVTKIVKMMQLMQGNVAHVPWEVIKSNPSIIKGCHDNNIKVHSHIFKQDLNVERKYYAQMTELGIDQCTIDDVELVQYV